MEQQPTLRNLVYDLDEELGGINLRKSALLDVQELLMKTVTDMNDKVHLGDEKVYFREWHQELRVLSELMYYIMQDFNEDLGKAQLVSQAMFDKIVRQGESNHGNAS